MSSHCAPNKSLMRNKYNVQGYNGKLSSAMHIDPPPLHPTPPHCILPLPTGFMWVCDWTMQREDTERRRRLARHIVTQILQNRHHDVWQGSQSSSASSVRNGLSGDCFGSRNNQLWGCRGDRTTQPDVTWLKDKRLTKTYTNTTNLHIRPIFRIIFPI